MIRRKKLLKGIFFVGIFFMPLFAVDAISQTSKNLPILGTKEMLGKLDGVDIQVVVQSPASQETPLQIICVFEYVEGDILNSPPALPKELNGLLHVDEALHGLITELRKMNKFHGRNLETLLITPPPNTIPAEKLLIIGLGNRHDFKPESMRLVGLVGMREALRLGVISYAHASDLKDAGISSPTSKVSSYVVQGAIEAYRTQKYLKEHNASGDLTVNKITLLSGPAFFEDSKEGVKKVIETQLVPTLHIKNYE